MENNNLSLSPHFIDQLQILLKKEAGFESFNFDNPSLNSPPSSPSSTLIEAITGPNPCSDVLRCKDCNGELFRGQDSIICVYCGRAPLYNCIHHPISFKDSLAFRWFSKALDLDGFERVRIPVRGDGFGDRGRGSVKEEEIALSDFLDLELKWQDESRGFHEEAEEQCFEKRYLSLVGVDLEEISAKGSIDHGFNVRDEQAVTSPKIGNEESGVSRQRSFNFFENTQSTEVALRSGEGGSMNEESFSDWGADFQSAAPSASNLTIENNLWTKLESGPPLNPKVSDGNTLDEGGGKAIESVDPSFDGLPAYQQPNAKDNSADAEKRDDDDSFDEWGDFRMSMNDNVTQCVPSSTAVHGSDGSVGLTTSDPLDEFTDFVASKDIQLPKNSFNAWNNFTTPSTGADIQSQAISVKLKQHVGTGDLAFDGVIDLAPLDVTYLEHQGINVARAQDKISDQGDSIGLWSNDIYLGIKGELDQLQGIDSKLPSKGIINENSDSLYLWNDFKVSDNHQKETKDVSSFDVWNDFTGFGIGEKKEQSSSLEVIDEKGREGNNHSIDTWSDFAGTSGVFDYKPMIINDISSEAWNDFSSAIASHAYQPQISNTITSKDQAVLKDDDLVSSWGDFRSLENQSRNSSLESNDNNTNLDKIGFQNAPNSVIKVVDNSTVSLWSAIGGATSSFEQSLQAAGAGSSENKLSSRDGDLFSGFSNSGKQLSSQSDNKLRDGVKIQNGESTLENDDLFDAWSDFTCSSNVQTILNTSENADDDKEAFKHGNLFDAWNVTVSSPKVQAGKGPAVAIEKTPGLKFPDMNLPYVGPTSLMPLAPNVGVSSHQNGSAPVSIPPEGPDLVRTEHGEVKADCYVDGMNPSVGTSKEASDFKSSDTLISEMHDLSFMLESSLSVPNSGE